MIGSKSFLPFIVSDLGFNETFYWSGRTGIEDIDVGMVAVFDGHNGAEASDMASKLLLEYFLLHLYFLLDGIYSKVLRNSDEKLTYGEQNMVFQVLNLDRGQNWHKLDPKRCIFCISNLYLCLCYAVFF